jgi:uroporphyrinogen-III decarboxylase
MTENTTTACDFDVTQLPAYLNFDFERIELAKQRQAAVWKGKKPDAWPIVLRSDLTEQQKKIPTANFEEAFYSKELMLCQEAHGACSVGNSRSDAIPSIRVNFGTGILLSCLGLEQTIFPDKMPWLKEHLTKEQVSELTPDDIEIKGSFEKGLEYMRFFKEILGDSLPVFCMDTQGPLDLAHLMIGDQIFYEFYDDPPFVHHLMNLSLELGIKAHEWMKEINGEQQNEHYHSGMLYSNNMGIRICEDTTAIIEKSAMEEFAMPYTRRLAQHFDGAWVHYCGRNDNLTRLICEIPEVRGINFGLIPGHEYDHQFEEDMNLIKDHGKVGWLDWPRFENESSKDYLKRMHYWASQGALIPGCNRAIGGGTGEDLDSVEAVKDYWYSL